MSATASICQWVLQGPVLPWWFFSLFLLYLEFLLPEVFTKHVLSSSHVPDGLMDVDSSWKVVLLA